MGARVMSIELLNAAIANSRAPGGSAQAVLLVLANYANASGEAWPSVQTIARGARVSLTTAREAIRALKRVGHLQVERAGGGHTSNRYRVVIASPAESAPLRNPHPCTTETVGAPLRNPEGSSPESEPDPSITTSTNHQGTTSAPKKLARQRARTAVAAGLPGLVASDQQLVELYARLFEQTHGQKPRIEWARDRGLMKAMLTGHSAEQIDAALRAFFASRDPFIVKSGHTLTLFRSQFNKFHLEASRPIAAHGFSGSGRTAGNVAELQDFVRSVQGGAR